MHFMQLLENYKHLLSDIYRYIAELQYQKFSMTVTSRHTPQTQVLKGL